MGQEIDFYILYKSLKRIGLHVIGKETEIRDKVCFNYLIVEWVS